MGGARMSRTLGVALCALLALSALSRPAHGQAEAANGVPGRKNLLLFSKGFGRSHLFEGETSPVVHAEVTGAGVPGNPIQEKYLSDRRLFEPTLHALQAARINLYPVDLATDYRE